jgi:GTP pyrophosphokinase
MSNDFYLTLKAVDLVIESHDRQMYGKEPYAYHCFRVAARVLDLSTDTVAFRCALLHDIAEDTDITINDIERLFGEETAEIIDYLTRRKNEIYADYISRVIKNPLATLIKTADLEENIHHSYLDDFSTNFESLRFRWETALSRIRNASI